MKSGLVWILALSLCANGVLLAARWRATQPARPTVSSTSPTMATSPHVPVSAPPISPDVSGSAASTASLDEKSQPAPEGSLWASLDLGDLRSVVAKLRTAGMPEDDVRVIADSLISDRFKARYEAIQVDRRELPFWRSGSSNVDAIRRYAESNAIWREAEALRAELFGDVVLEPLAAFRMRERYGPLPEARLAELQRIDRDYSELAAQVRGAFFGATMPWEKEQLQFIESEKERDLAASLNPEEYKTYQLYASSTAIQMRRQLEGLAATESEFRAIFALQQAFDQKYSLAAGAISAADMRASENAKPELLAQIKAALGEERYKDYERATDQGFQAALAMTKRLQLPVKNATEAFTLAEDTRAAVKTLNRDTALTPSERAVAMAELLETANVRLETLLTRSGADAFRSRSNPWRYVESELKQKQQEAR